MKQAPHLAHMLAVLLLAAGLHCTAGAQTKNEGPVALTKAKATYLKVPPPQSEVQQLQARIENLELQINQLKQQQERDQALIRQANAQHDSQPSKFPAVNPAQLKQLQDDMQQLQDRNADLETQLAQEKQRLAQAQADIAQLREQLATTGRDLASAQQEIKDLRTQLAANEPFDREQAWLWGGAAALAALASGVLLSRKYWPHKVSAPMSVSASLGAWSVQVRPAASTERMPGFGVRAQWIPVRSELRVASPPLLLRPAPT